MPTKLSRRDFMLACAGSAAAISLSSYLAPFMAEAAAAGAPPVIWLQGASCTGCSIALLNAVNPDIKELLLNVISLKYHPNVMAAAGDLAIQDECYKIAKDNPKGFFLVVEGSVPTGAEGRFCMVGEENEQPIMFEKLVKDIGSQAQAYLKRRNLFLLWRLAGDSTNSYWVLKRFLI